MIVPLVPGDDRRLLTLECQCSSAHHLVVFWLDEHNYQDGSKREVEITIGVQLVQWGSLWHRFKTAVRYFFGFDEPHGHWGVTILKPEDEAKLVELLEASRAARAKADADFAAAQG